MNKEKIIIKAILSAIKVMDFKSAWKIITNPRATYNFLEQLDKVEELLEDDLI